MRPPLGSILKGKVIIIGVGNVLKQDDGFGPAFAARLQGLLHEEATGIMCIDAGSAPENYIGKIAKENPDTVLIVDAADLGKEPGEYEIVKKEDIVKSGFSTHDLSPAAFMEFLARETGADIYLLGVQPEKVDFGEGLTARLTKRFDELAALVIRAIRLRKRP